MVENDFEEKVIENEEGLFGVPNQEESSEYENLSGNVSVFTENSSLNHANDRYVGIRQKLRGKSKLT